MDNERQDDLSEIEDITTQIELLVGQKFGTSDFETRDGLTGGFVFVDEKTGRRYELSVVIVSRR